MKNCQRSSATPAVNVKGALVGICFSSFLRQAQDRLFILHSFDKLRTGSSSFLRRPSSLASGFTLIEILVVLVVIGISIALVGVNLHRDPKQQLREQSQRLALLLQAARSEAITSGKSLAWIAQPPNYGFYTRGGDRKWTVAMTDEPFVAGAFPGQITLADVQINRARVPVDTPLEFSASGLNPSFRLVLDYAGARMLVAGDAGGSIRAGEATEQSAAVQ